MRHAFDAPAAVTRDRVVLNYASAGTGRRGKCFPSLVEWLVIMGITTLLVSLLLPVVSRGPCGVATSADHLRRIGQFAHCYALDYGGDMPEDFAQLTAAYPEMPPRLFVPPRSEVPRADTLHQMLTEPGLISYAWTGAGLRMEEMPADAMLAYQVGFASYDQGTYVLFADCTARRVRGEELRQLIMATQRRLDAPLPGLPMDMPTPALREGAASPE